MSLENSSQNTYVTSEPVEEKVKRKASSTTWNIAKVFMFMFMFIAISAVSALGVLVAMRLALNAGADPNIVANTYLIMLIVSAISMFVLMLVINFVFLRGKHSVLVPGIIFSVIVGVLLSALTMVIVAAFGANEGIGLIGMAFGITCGTYLIMSFIAFLSKGNMSVYIIAIIGLSIGSITLVLLNLFLRSSTISWIISFAIFAIIIFTTIFDLHNVKRIAETGNMTKNLELFCAFNLYVDFINIFIRILYYLVIIFARRK